MAVKNERLEALRQRLDTVAEERKAIKSVDERWNAAAQDLVDEERRWDAERQQVLALANKVGPALRKAGAKLLDDTEAYLDQRETYAQLSEQYEAVLRRARAAGIEGDIPLIPSISAQAARMDENAYRIRRIVRRLQEVRAW